MVSSEFWGGLNKMNTLRDVPRYWEQTFGHAHAAATSFLRPGNGTVFRYPCLVPCGKACRMHVHTRDGCFTAFCPETPPQASEVTLEPMQAVIQVLDVNGICRNIALALNMAPSVCSDQFLDNAWHIGAVKLPHGKSASVYLVLPLRHFTVDSAVRDILLRGSEPPVILLPSVNSCPANTRTTLEDKGGHLIALDQNVSVRDGGNMESSHSLARIVMAKLGDSDPMYMFERRGKHYYLRWDGGRVEEVDANVGMHRCHQLLMHPREPIPAFNLQNGHQVAAEKGKPSAGIETVDEDELQKRKRHFDELLIERAEAEENGQISWVEKLNRDIDALGHSLDTDANVRGKARKVKDPYEQARKNVQRSLERAYTAIGGVLPPMASHLKSSISVSKAVTYSPTEDIMWNV